MAETDIPLLNLTSTCWRDESFLKQWSLNKHTVLEYFARSPCYVPTCNNEECKRQGLSLDMLHTMKPGVEFVLASCQEPVLYIIKRQYRQSPDRTRQEAFYYILHGTVYMAPTLHACMSSRMDRCLFNLENAFDILKHDLEPLEWKERARLRRVKAAEKAALKAASTAQLSDLRLEEKDAKLDDKPMHEIPVGSKRSLDTRQQALGAAEQYSLPQKPLTRQKEDWIHRTDTVVLNVLSRFEVPLYSAPEEESPSEPVVEATQPAADAVQP